MNLYKKYLNEIKKNLSKNKSKINLKTQYSLDNIVLESPPEKFNFDFSCNAAMALSKSLNKNSRDLAEIIRDILKKGVVDFEKIEIAGPGFINITLNNKAWLKIINDILKNKAKYGSNKYNKKYNVEFVSANPTGPLHVGHCRGAIFGDVLSNLLKFNGNKVIKEFYINDYGNQINDFTRSVYFRLREIKLKENFPNENNLYPGAYVIDIAKNILKKNPKIKLNEYKKMYSSLKDKALKESMNLIKNDLRLLGIYHDYFFSESKLVNDNLVIKSINKLKKENIVQEGFLEPPKGEEKTDWKKKKRLIFKSTMYGDDVDRALQKDDGTWTYFANDLAYHFTKVNRKFDHLINILGADHTGYIKRITAAVHALSKDKVKLNCKVCQLVKLFKKGIPFKMSKRQGDFITVSDLLNEVSKDSVRFMMLNRGNDVEIDFDFDKVLEKTKDNPVFYVQYCYARINSLFKTAGLPIKNKINVIDFQPNEYETKLLRKIVEWPKIIDLSSNKYEPHRIPFYLYELANIFHSYWSRGNEDSKFKFLENGKIKNKLSLKLFQITLAVLENGMKILGVSLPKRM